MPVYLYVSVVCASVAQFLEDVLFSFCLNFVEVGFDSPAKLATGVPPFKVNPLLWHCTSSALSGIRR